MIAAGPVPGSPKSEAIRAFYTSETGGGMRMRTSLDGGKTWGALITASEGTYGNVAIDGKGRIHIVVAMADPRGPAAFGSPENTIAYTVSTDGKTFAKPITAAAQGESIPFYFINPSIADRRTPRLDLHRLCRGRPTGDGTSSSRRRTTAARPEAREAQRRRDVREPHGAEPRARSDRRHPARDVLREPRRRRPPPT